MRTGLINIFDMNNKKKGIAAAVITLSLAILSGMLTACNSTATATVSSPVEVVTQYLTALKNNDTKALVATLTVDHEIPENTKLGVISLEIIEVKNETDSRYMEEALESEAAKENGWTKDNLAFVSAIYDAQYDNKLVPYDSGRQKWVFKLLRLSADSPWLIKDWGHARFE